MYGTRGDQASAHETLARLGQRHVAAGDRGRARAAIRLQYIAVDRDGALAECLEIDDRAQRSADEALDLLSAPALLAASGLARCARVSRPGQHAVLGRHPALAFAAQKLRDRVLDARGAQHLRITVRDQ